MAGTLARLFRFHSLNVVCVPLVQHQLLPTSSECSVMKGNINAAVCLVIEETAKTLDISTDTTRQLCAQGREQS